MWLTLLDLPKYRMDRKEPDVFCMRKNECEVRLRFVPSNVFYLPFI